MVGGRVESSLTAETEEEGRSCFASTTDEKPRVLQVRCLASEVISNDSVNRDTAAVEAAWDRFLIASNETTLWAAASGPCQFMMVLENMAAVEPAAFNSLLSDDIRLSCVGRLVQQHRLLTSNDSHRIVSPAMQPSGDMNYFNQKNTTDWNYLQNSTTVETAMLYENNVTTTYINVINTTTTTTTTTSTTTTNNVTTTNSGGGPAEALDAATLSAFIRQRLVTLDLSRNKLRNVASEFLWNLSHLQHVNLSENLLESFPRRLPHHISTLDLSENRLENLVISVEAEDKRRRRPLGLVSLNVTRNYLKELSNRTAPVLKTLMNLEEFRASNNLIGRIDAGLFSCHSFKQLKKIDLSRNRLTNLTNYSFANLYSIQILNFSYNEIRNVEFHAFYNFENPDECRKDFYYQSLISADLKSGSKACHNGRWPFLEILDLSHNLLSNVPDVIFLSPLCAVRQLLLGHNHIVHLLRYVIEQLHHLEVIDLQHNAVVWLDVGTFTNQNLRRIDLSHNSLRKIISMTFLYLPSVYTIDLSYNSISYIYKYAFYRICNDDGRHLIRISLRGNQLDSDGVWKVLSLFQHQAMSKCSVSADLSNNRITHIIGDARQFLKKQMDTTELERFRFWNKLQLDLKDNQMRCDCELSEDIAILSRIVLRLGNNGSVLNWETLRCSGPEVFQGVLLSDFVSSLVCPVRLTDASYCPDACECKDRVLEERSVRYINCSGRQLNNFPPDIFLQKDLMAAIDLSYNNLDRLHLDVSLPRVTYLDLSHNHLTRVSDNTIARLPALEQLLLHDNHLQLIPDSILKSVLKNVTISGNPLLCQFSENSIQIETLTRLQEVVSDWQRARCSDGRHFVELNLTKTDEFNEVGSVQQRDVREEIETEPQLRLVIILLAVVVFFGFAAAAAAGLVRCRSNIVEMRKNTWSKISNIHDIVKHDIFVSYSDTDDA